MIPRPEQEECADLGYEIFRKNAIVYLAMEERTGKTLTAILIAEMANVTNILVITKKKALSGWTKTIQAFKPEKQYTVINYHSLHKLENINYDCVIIDEAHNYISGYPKRSKIWLAVAKLTKGLPLIYLSATPYAQTPALLFNQFALSTWSPWHNYSNYYEWYKSFGTGKTKWIHSQEVKCYDSVKDKDVLACVEHLFITKTRKELGFRQEPKDKLHYIELTEETKEFYNTLLKDRVIEEPFSFVADTPMLLRTGLHQVEGGTLKTTSYQEPEDVDSLVKRRKEKVKDEDGALVGIKFHDYHTLPNKEKIQFILDTWGDSEDIAIMYNYIAEGIKLQSFFKKAHILQATSNAEGVDLMHIKHLVIYSQDFSTARHTQRRARQANKNREDSIIVHYLLIPKGISEQVYNTVSVNKQNYVDSVFIREEL